MSRLLVHCGHVFLVVQDPNRPGFRDRPMSRDWLLGGRWYVPQSDLGEAGDSACSWHLVQAQEGGGSLLLQRWAVCPPSHELDKLRETYLQRFLEAEPLDPAFGRFGFGEDKAWFLQELPGLALSEVWPDWSPACRKAFLEHLKGLLLRNPHPRFLSPFAIRLHPGRILVPRALGEAPFAWKDFEAALELLKGSANQEGPRLWEQAPEISDDLARPIRGRSQELTYLKSLVFGLNAPAPMERVLVLTGEEGLGQDPLADWAAAAVETEGLWVAAYEVEHQEVAGNFLARLLQDLLRGFEADFYASRPETARILARRLESFAFLRGGRKATPGGAAVEPQEIQAAIEVFDFATSLHPRMLFVRDVDRAEEDLQRLLASLAVESKLPWFFTLTAVGQPGGLREFLGPLKGNPVVSFMTLSRMEDAGLGHVIADLLGPHIFPEAFRQGLLNASLGNPGLLRAILESAQLDGTLQWGPQGWTPAPGSLGGLKVHENLVVQILAGRLQRIGPLGLAVTRTLALADQPLEPRTLGMALGIAGDPLDEALRVAVSARLVHLKEGRAALADPRIQDLALSGNSISETRRLAKSLLRALGDEAGRPVLSVRLQSLASDDKSALAHVLRAIEQDPPPPQDAERVVNQALQLGPTPNQRARLWEFLADAWTLGTLGGRVPAAVLAMRSPLEFALESLGLAEAALSECPEKNDACRGQLARLLRKRALLELRLRDLPPAMRAIQAAAEVLTGLPHHPEQARLFLALGRAHMLAGFQGKGIKAFEEGLQVLGPEGQMGEPRDRFALLVELGQGQRQKGQFQRALATLQAAQRLLEREQDLEGRAEVQGALAQIRFAMGQPELAYEHLHDALHSARMLDDLERQAECHLDIGIFRSLEQNLETSLQHLDNALARFTALGNRVGGARARVWRARTLAAMGETVEAEMELLQVLSMPPERLTAAERGDFAFLQAEVASFRGSVEDAARSFKSAAHLFQETGLLWRERLARLRELQAEAHVTLAAGPGRPIEKIWTALENLKAPVEGSGSRWLEMEWHRAHALLLMAAPEASEAVVAEALSAWSEVQAAARELRFLPVALEASAQSSALLLNRGEKLGARSRLQDAFGTFQEIWSRVPEAHGMAFLGRPDMHRFRQAVEAAGLRFILPERVDPLADWTPTQITAPPVGSLRGNP
ncbi:MAG: hypothetical protein IPN59_02025 [Holophaga sp.]|nr:hypothetical protein [Holophaga sp.]